MTERGVTSAAGLSPRSVGWAALAVLAAGAAAGCATAPRTGGAACAAPASAEASGWAPDSGAAFRLRLPPGFRRATPGEFGPGLAPGERLWTAGGPGGATLLAVEGRPGPPPALRGRGVQRYAACRATIGGRPALVERYHNGERYVVAAEWVDAPGGPLRVMGASPSAADTGAFVAAVWSVRFGAGPGPR